jgi:hypothetical protein
MAYAGMPSSRVENWAQVLSRYLKLFFIKYIGTIFEARPSPNLIKMRSVKNISSVNNLIIF